MVLAVHQEEQVGARMRGGQIAQCIDRIPAHSINVSTDYLGTYLSQLHTVTVLI